MGLDEFVKRQRELAAKLDRRCPFESPHHVRRLAACDADYRKKDGIARASVLVFEYPEMKLVDTASHDCDLDKLMPYHSGFLSFREAPEIIGAFGRLKVKPDVLMCDGQGIAHPRGFGLAAHIGVELDVSTIGCAKSRLYGDYEEPPPGLPGAYTFLKDPAGTVIGAVLRTRPRVRPVFVSVGNKMSLSLAVDLVMGSVRGRRIPEPLRMADMACRR